MNYEGLAMVPRNKRPSLDELDGYQPRYDPDMDYSAYMRELAMWLSDYRRDEENDRLDKGRTPLMGHEDAVEQRHTGYDPSNFDIHEVAFRSKTRPLH
jgi:hypothetical protein